MTTDRRGWVTRERALTFLLAFATLLSLYICYRIMQPFFPVLAWALALAVVAHPVHRWINRRIRKPGVAATLSVIVVTVLLIGPAVLVGQALVNEAQDAFQMAQEMKDGSLFEQIATRVPALRPGIDWVRSRVNIAEEAERLGRDFSGRVPGILGGGIRAIAGLLITLFTLFFFLRDHRLALQAVRSFLPLTREESDRLFDNVAVTIQATVFGSVVIAFLQGGLAGLMFWILGLPAPLLWAFVMSFLALIPTLGAPVVWGPAALVLLIQGQWVKALILTAWGLTAVGLIDNLLYPHLVGSRLHLHTLAVFFAVIGGLAVFGMAGLVLGPVAFAITLALIEIWRDRTAEGRPAEEAVEQPS